MDLAEYQTLTGITVPAAQVALVTAQLARTQAMLETMLGYPLTDPAKINENLYNELGKAQQECACPSVSDENLSPPDPVVKAYRLYRYNHDDVYFAVDPFTKVHAVKLVYVRPGDTPNGITVKTFDDDEVKIVISREGFSKYIEHCRQCLCLCECTDCVMLAVDADWAWPDEDDIPVDLKYVWADMVTYYSNPKKDIKSESILTHSYTKFERKTPEMEPHNLAVIRRYAGPYGSVSVEVL